MKKYFLSIVICCYSFGVHTQTLFAPDSSKWTQHYGGAWYSIGGQVSSYVDVYSNYFIHGDTLVNNKSYQKLYSAGSSNKIDTTCYSFYKYIYNDSGIIYSGMHIDSLTLLYNFNLAKGDSFPIIGAGSSAQYQTYYSKVDSVNTVMYAGRYRKWIRFKYLPGGGAYSTIPTWVEGIGDINYGLVFDYYQIMGYKYSSFSISNSSYDCFYDAATKSIVGSCVYTNCLLNSIQIFNNSNEVEIFPNPANSAIQVIINNKQLLEVKVFDALDNELLQTTQNSIDVSNLANGFYFVEIKTNEGVASKKIVIQR